MKAAAVREIPGSIETPSDEGGGAADGKVRRSDAGEYPSIPIRSVKEE
jgi:hypothetical protein